VRLDRLQRNVAITESNGRPTLQFQAAEQRKIEQIEAAFQSLEEQVAAIAAAQAAANAANAAAVAADAAAVAAQGAADDAASISQITSSGVSGLTMTATDAGANATITISGHTRVYGDGTSVSVTGGSITGLAYSTTYYVYYDQASRLGGAVTYQATTSQATGAQTGNRHALGAVTTPAAAGAPINGNNNLPPGVVEP
jgi:hypothetical protein